MYFNQLWPLLLLLLLLFLWFIFTSFSARSCIFRSVLLKIHGGQDGELHGQSYPSLVY